MVEGKIEIYLSYKEPEYRDNIMWLRPYLDREGFELLYYGTNGWTVFVPCHPTVPIIKPQSKPEKPQTPVTQVDDTPMVEIEPNPVGDTAGNLHEITPAIKMPEKKHSCRCPN